MEDMLQVNENMTLKNPIRFDFKSQQTEPKTTWTQIPEYQTQNHPNSKLTWTQTQKWPKFPSAGNDPTQSTQLPPLLETKWGKNKANIKREKNVSWWVTPKKNPLNQSNVDIAAERYQQWTFYY